MFDTSFIVKIINTTVSGMVDLFYPALFFITLSLILRGVNETTTGIKNKLSQTMLNLMIILFNLILISPIIFFISSFMNSLEMSLINYEFWENKNSFIVIFIAVFLGDFIGYWRHRLEHSRLLWASHAIHHSDDNMGWLTLERFHPINRITTFVIDTTILSLLGLPLYAIIANNIVRHYYGYFIHSDLKWDMGLLGKIFVSPSMHQWHHASVYRAFNTNYATIFSIFDRMFGTYYVPRTNNIPLGVNQDMGDGLAGQLLYPFKLNSYKRPKKKK